jgi:hypothetical protein
MSTSGLCSGIKLPRNAQGYTASAGLYQAGACGQRALRAVSDEMTGVTQSVDNLMVRHRLITNQQIGGTLTLQGNGSPDPTYEAALCVKAGANIQGLSQHGLLRVIGDSYMGGPVAMTQCYGPLNISNAPDAVPVTEVLTVDGGASSISFFSQIITTPLIQTDVAIVMDLAVQKKFTFDGYYAGPLAAAELTALTSTWNVTLKATAGATTYTVLGVAVSNSTILVPYVLKASAPSVTLNNISDPLIITVQLSSGAFRALTVSVLRTMPTGNAALLKIDDSQGFLFGTFAELAPYLFDADTPEPGAPVLVITGDNNPSMGGTRSAVAGYVTEPSGQMFYEYTSLHVVLPTLQAQASGAAMTDGSVGGAIYDYRGRLLAMLQYGTLNSVPDSVPVPSVGATLFQTTVGGIKARYLTLLTNPVPVGISAPIIDFPATNYSVRGIGTLERSVGLKTGGVTYAAVGSSATLSDQLISYTSANVSTVFLGSKGTNTPSYQDSVLRSYRDLNTTAAVVFADDLGLSDTYTDAQVWTTAYWNKGPPIITFPLSSSFCGYSNASTDFIKAKTGTLTQVLFNTGATPFSAQAVAMTHGYQTGEDSTTTFIVAWGNHAKLNTWFTGFSGYIKDSWNLAYPSAPTGDNLFVIAGYESADWTTRFYASLSNANLFTAYTTYNVTYTIGNPVQIDVTNNASESITYFLQAGSSYNWFSYTGIVSNCGWPLNSTNAIVSWTDGTPGSVTITAATAPPTALY